MEQKKQLLVIYHSADLDGIGSREVIRHFLNHPDSCYRGHNVHYIGWDYGDDTTAVLALANLADLTIMADICIDALMQDFIDRDRLLKLVWIDHHVSSIDKWASYWLAHLNGLQPKGYRLDGVAACRLCWAYFSWWIADETPTPGNFPTKQDFVDRKVNEPYLITLLGEHDVWDHRDPNSQLAQYGLKAGPFDWSIYFTAHDHRQGVLRGMGAAPTSGYSQAVAHMLDRGQILNDYVVESNRTIAKRASLVTRYKGWRFLMLNCSLGNSRVFDAVDNGPDSLCPVEVDALLMWYLAANGQVSVSMYHARGKEGADLSVLAKELGGGGHKGACGFRVPFDSFRTLFLIHAQTFSQAKEEKEFLAETFKNTGKEDNAAG